MYPNLDKGIEAVAALPSVAPDLLKKSKIGPVAQPFLSASDIHPDGGAGPDGTFCLQAWACKKFGGKLKNDYTVKGTAAAFIVGLLDEAAKAFAESQPRYGELPYRGWDKGIGFIVAYPLREHPEVSAKIWNLTMQRIGVGDTGQP